MKPGKVHYYKILFLALYPVFIYPQISWGIKTEGGLFFSEGSGKINSTNLIAGVDGEASYTLNMDRSKAAVLVKAKPEFSKELSAVKLRLKGGYYQEHENFEWGVNLIRQKNIFKDKDTRLEYDIFLFDTEASCYFIEEFPFTLDIGYASQDAENQSKKVMDLFFMDIQFFSQINSYYKIGLGFYAEKFQLTNEVPTSSELSNVNTGWRSGPQASINYLKDWIFRAEYQFLIHLSDVTEQPSFDQSIRILAGRIFLNDFSAFIIADYYSRRYRFKNSAPEKIPLVYTPIDQENNIYFKLGYDLDESTCIYIRSGYFNEKFFNETIYPSDGLSYSGWNILLGMEIER